MHICYVQFPLLYTVRKEGFQLSNTIILFPLHAVEVINAHMLLKAIVNFIPFNNT